MIGIVLAVKSRIPGVTFFSVIPSRVQIVQKDDYSQ